MTSIKNLLRGAMLLALLFVFGALRAQSGDVVGQVTVGYQGWFAARDDGSPINAYWHWTQNWGQLPSASNNGIKSWPDMREYTNRYSTAWPNLGNGSPATLYSNYDAQTVNTHFKWMQENNIHTAALQRFNPTGGEGPIRDVVTARVKDAAENYGVKFYIMYDVTNWLNMQSEIKSDYLNKMKAYTTSPAYAHQDDKPVVCIWGFGFSDDGRPFQPAECLDVINWFKNQGCYVIGGVPTHWRNENQDSRPGFISVYKAFDMISPWMVGRIGDAAGSDWFYSNVNTQDQAFCNANGMAYQPCVLPGDLQEGQRAHGNFMWRQFYNMTRVGAQAIYISMYDEYNEGNQIAKTAENTSQVPSGSNFVTLDEDGVAVSSDYYLRLTGDGARMLSGAIALTAERPTPYFPPTNELQSPYNGSPATIPGVIEAEHFDNGGEGVAYHDSDALNNGGLGRINESVDTEAATNGGLNIGWTANNEWVEYTVQVSSSGLYDIELLMASPNTNGSLHIEMDAEDITGLITSPYTGDWQTWDTVTISDVALSAGQQTMRIFFDVGNYNLDKVTFSYKEDDDLPENLITIRNAWQNTYLYDAGNSVGYGNSPVNASYYWTLENLGDNWFEIKNAETGDYMHAENLTGDVECTNRPFGWTSSRWSIETTSDASVRMKNQWQNNQYIHIEGLNGYAQYGSINMEWQSAKWYFTEVSPNHARKTAQNIETDFYIYPNPSSGKSINVHFNAIDDEDAKIMVYSAAGKLCVSQVIQTADTPISLTNAHSGIYILKIKTSSQVFTQKILIE